MKQLIILITIFGLSLFSCSKYVIPQFTKPPPDEYMKYPHWYIPKIQLKHSGVPGTEYHWYMTHKGSSTKDKYPDSALMVLPAFQGKPINIKIQSQFGNPVIAIYDRFFHKNDFFSLINLYENTMGLPGSPLAFGVGSEGILDFCYTPRYNGMHTAYIWLLNGELKEPKPFVREDFSIYEGNDSMFIEIGEDMLELMIITDSLHSLDIYQNALDNRTIKSMDFNRTKVDIFINASTCNDNLTKDYYYELYKDIDIEKFQFIGTMMTSADARHWYTLNQKYDSLRSLSVKQAREWHKNEVSFNNNYFELSLEESLRVWTKNPILQTELLRRTYYYDVFTEEGDYELIKKVLYATKNGEFDILSNELSLMLAQMLSEVSAVNGAIYDREGFMVATTQPFTLMNVKENSNWDIIENSTSEYTASNCYSRAGFNVDFKKLFMPIKYKEDNSVIGWLMVEIYCK